MTDPVPSSKRHWTGLLFICLSLLLISLAKSIMNVALPSIARGLGATTVELQWVVEAGGLPLLSTCNPNTCPKNHL